MKVSWNLDEPPTVETSQHRGRDPKTSGGLSDSHGPSLVKIGGVINAEIATEGLREAQGSNRDRPGAILCSERRHQAACLRHVVQQIRYYLRPRKVGPQSASERAL